MRRTRVQNFLAVTLGCINIEWVIGQVVRDSSEFTALFFYIPSVLLLIANLIVIVFIGRKRTAFFFGLFVLLTAGSVVGLENRWSFPANTESRALRVVHWNIYWGRFGLDAILDQLAEENPDVAALSEVPENFESNAKASDFRLGYRIGQEGMLGYLVRGEVDSRAWIANKPELKVLRLDCIVKDSPLRLFIVDIPASLEYHRDPILRELNGLIAADRPDIVLGDFNSPRRSLALSELPEGYAHAYDLAGKGWSYTWPSFLPFLAIDQCIVGSRITPIRYDIQPSFRSDHARQVVDLDLKADFSG